jgi:rhomboid family GlyGly-CTERM serine protease
MHLAGTAVQPTYIPAAVAAGEWWRILLHPFAHVSGYHLWLDGAAFFTLYHALRERRHAVRLGLVIAAGAGSLALSLSRAPQVEHLGLCGLSGIGHGLMTVVALEMIRDRDTLGWPCLAGVLAKTLWEALTGHVVLQAWHLGSVGSPVVVSHLGGVLGAGAFWGIAHAMRDGEDLSRTVLFTTIPDIARRKPLSRQAMRLK